MRTSNAGESGAFVKLGARKRDMEARSFPTGCLALIGVCILSGHCIQFASAIGSVQRRLLLEPPEAITPAFPLPQPGLSPTSTAPAPAPILEDGEGEAALSTAPVPEPPQDVVLEAQIAGVSEGTSSAQTHDARCGAGCIAGAVIGGTAGLLLLLAVLFYVCCRRTSVKDEVMSTTDLELLDYPGAPAQGGTQQNVYNLGESVFCRKGRNCTYGIVIDILKGDEFLVQIYDGSSEVAKSSQMAPNFAEGTEVWYSPPDGRRQSCLGRIIQADGSYWPPFYQLIPHEGDVNLVNTTAECLTEVKKGAPAHYISAKAA